MSNEECGLLKFYNYIQGLCWKHCKWQHNTFCQPKRQERWKDSYSLLREVPEEKKAAMIFTPDILHLGMGFWKTLLQVCVCVISDSHCCFNSIQRFLLNNAIYLVLYFGIFLINYCFMWTARVYSLNWKFSWRMWTHSEKSTSSCHQARFLSFSLKYSSWRKAGD